MRSGFAGSGDSRRWHYLFGPVQSRRLGVSLGVDMVPAKTCTLNCVYCECGTTILLTTERRPYYPASEIIDELRDYLSGGPVLDFVTFGGSGEPTLNTALGEVVSFVKTSFPHYRTALLTNGTLLSLPEVRTDAMAFDVVLPSLDAATDETFARINGPAFGCTVGRLIEGLADFSRQYRGELLLEIFIVEGLNDTAADITALKNALLLIRPQRVQLNCLDRPGTQAWVRPARSERLEQIAAALAPFPVDIIARSGGPTPLVAPSQLQSDPAITLLSALRRRPLTMEDACNIVKLPVREIHALVRQLESNGLIEHRTIGNHVFLCRRQGSE